MHGSVSHEQQRVFRSVGRLDDDSFARGAHVENRTNQDAVPPLHSVDRPAMSAIAVRGIRMDDAKNAVPPTTANAPGGLAGRIRFQAPLINVAIEAPIAALGVNKPPSLLPVTS
jgi:hypothetical protein